MLVWCEEGRQGLDLGVDMNLETACAEPPLDTPLLIYEPDALGPDWYFAVRTKIWGSKQPRWKVFGRWHRKNVVVFGSHFKPLEWMPLEPTIN